MPFSDLDDEPRPAPRHWNPLGPTPVVLRDYWLVYADAEPTYDAAREVYGWVRAPVPWFGIDPPRGTIPCELWDRIQFLTRLTDRFQTRDGARASLQMAILDLERVAK